MSTPSMNEVERFIGAWEFHAKGTLDLLRGLPAGQYDFRPDPQGRSLGELAWHLAEIDGYISRGAVSGTVDFDAKYPDLERPRTIEALADGFERVHRDAVARVAKLQPADFEKSITFVPGQPMTVGLMLWGALLHHHIHHRGQLTLICRLAGGKVPGLFGPTRESWEEMKAKAGKA